VSDTGVQGRGSAGCKGEVEGVRGCTAGTFWRLSTTKGTKVRERSRGKVLRKVSLSTSSSFFTQDGSLGCSTEQGMRGGWGPSPMGWCRWVLYEPPSLAACPFVPTDASRDECGEGPGVHWQATHTSPHSLRGGAQGGSGAGGRRRGQEGWVQSREEEPSLFYCAHNQGMQVQNNLM